MLEIVNEQGYVLEIPDNVGVPIERNNMLFNDSGKIYQDLSYSFKAPISANNKLFIQFGHLINSNNVVYQQKVSVYLDKISLFICQLNYSIKNNEIDCKLKPNFSTIAALFSSSNVSDIDDGSALDDMPIDNYEAIMLASCNTPDNYNFIFAPLYNTRLGEDLAIPTNKRDYVNFWDYANQKFIANAFASGTYLGMSSVPFPKLIYVLRQIANVIGCKITGNWKDTALAKSVYFESLERNYGTVVSGIIPGIYPICSYLPKMTIGDFLKQVKERFFLSFDFDFTKNEWQIESIDTALKKPVIDISKYVQEITEINAPDEKGYDISLKVNQSDINWEVTSGTEKKYLAHYNLLVGKAETKQELNIGTLKIHTDTNKKSVASELLLKDYSNRDYPLRMFKFDGMTTIETGKVWPQTSDFDLSIDDAKLYQFLNYSKQYRLTANIPNTVLMQITSISTISFITKEGDYVIAIIEKINYDLKPKQQFIKTDIICRNTKYYEKTKPILIDNFAALAANSIIFKYKSNAKNILPVIFFTLPDPSSTTINLETAANVSPCNKYGLGGISQAVKVPSTADFIGYTSGINLTFRISGSHPLELRINNKIIPFVLVGSNYEASLQEINGVVNDYFIVY